MFSYAPGRCAMTILGPDRLLQGLPNAFGVRVTARSTPATTIRSFPTSLGFGRQRVLTAR
ncbi:MAG: hypothetical protein IPK27_09940 [Rhodanobacteraceae bacterium]|nr:hypothetical protein [Rhodanobacteraceae bacterium]